MHSIHSFFAQNILFSRVETTQNPRSRSFLLRPARMFECTLFILCCSCAGWQWGWSSSLGSVLTPALGPARNTAWKKLWKNLSGGKYDQDGGWKNANIFIPTVVTSIDGGENIYSSKLIWLGTLPVENSKGKREKPQRNVVTDLTKPPWRHWQGTDPAALLVDGLLRHLRHHFQQDQHQAGMVGIPKIQLLGENGEPWNSGGEEQAINKP